MRIFEVSLKNFVIDINVLLYRVLERCCNRKNSRLPPKFKNELQVLY